MKNITKSLWLLAWTVVICCGIYPLVVWGIGQTFFPFTANGSVVTGPDGKLTGSLLIAQPFSKDEYFWPRPSAASYDASASASSALAASNYALRDRVARMLGPIVKYSSGPKAGQLAAPDIEAWFGHDRYQGQSHIVAQWADNHNELAQAWVTADPTHGQYVNDWAKSHKAAVTDWIKQNPATPKPQASDLAVPFFENFSKDNPGKFPSAVTKQTSAGKTQTSIEPLASGSDIQSIFFDMWRQDHPEAQLQNVPRRHGHGFSFRTRSRHHGGERGISARSRSFEMGGGSQARSGPGPHRDRQAHSNRCICADASVLWRGDGQCAAAQPRIAQSVWGASSLIAPRWHRPAYTRDCAQIYATDRGAPVSTSAIGSSTALNSRLGRHFDGRSWQRKGRLYEQHAVMPDNAADRPIECLHQHESGLS